MNLFCYVLVMLRPVHNRLAVKTSQVPCRGFSRVDVVHNLFVSDGYSSRLLAYVYGSEVRQNEDGIITHRYSLYRWYDLLIFNISLLYGQTKNMSTKRAYLPLPYPPTEEPKQMIKPATKFPIALTKPVPLEQAHKTKETTQKQAESQARNHWDIEYHKNRYSHFVALPD